MPEADPRDDFDLLVAWQDGDRDAGDALISRHFWSIYRFFRSKTDDAAEDLTQRTFLGCVEKRDHVKAELGFRAYLFGIARNQLLLYFRRYNRDAANVQLETTSVAALGSPSQVLAGKQEQRVLLSAMRQIPADFQITLELYYWEDMSVGEIAQVLDVAPGTVKSRLGRGRAMLREQIEQMKLPEDVRTSTLGSLEDWARAAKDDGSLKPK